jgi:hypothetical protein
MAELFTHWLLVTFTLAGVVLLYIGTVEIVRVWSSSRSREVPGEGGEGLPRLRTGSAGAGHPPDADPLAEDEHARDPLPEAEAERARDDGYDSDRDERWLEAER